MGEGIAEHASSRAQTTDFVCADCGDDVEYMDEVYKLHIVRLQRYLGHTVQCHVYDEYDQDSPFRFEPYYFCVDCWEKNYESIRKDMTDEPPVEDLNGKFECACCASDIRELELAGVVDLGEFHVSERSPNGAQSAVFRSISNDDKLCLYCLTVLNDGYIDMWKELSEFGECEDCIQARCWRTDTRGDCECDCHDVQCEGEGEELIEYPLTGDIP
jgi:hypothetical protein